MKYFKAIGLIQVLALLLVAFLLLGAGGERRLMKGARLLDQGKLEKAEIQYQKALSWFEKKRVPLGMLRSYEGLGDVAGASEEIGAAIHNYKMAEMVSNRLPLADRRRVRQKYEALEGRVYQDFIVNAPERWETYDAFQKEHPDSHKIKEAQRMRNALQFAPYLEGDTVDGYVSFLERFPANPLATLAVEKIYEHWGRFDDAGLQTAVNAYDAFLASYPQTSIRAAAVTMRSYYRALQREDLAAFLDFFEQYDFFERHRRAPVELIDAAALRRLLLALERYVDEFPTMAGFVLLYEQTDEGRYLDRAREYVSNADEEAYFVRLNPYTFIEFGEAAEKAEVGRRAEPFHSLVERYNEEGGVGVVLGLYLPKTETMIKPILDIPVRSLARYGTYRIAVKFELKILAERRLTGGLTDFLKGFSDQPTSESWADTLEREVEFAIRPQAYEVVEVSFGEIKANSQQSFVGLFGVEDRRTLSGLSYRIAAVARADGNATEAWRVSLAGRDMADFELASRRFTALVERTRSQQIDAMQERAVEGALEILRGEKNDRR